MIEACESTNGIFWRIFALFGVPSLKNACFSGIGQ